MKKLVYMLSLAIGLIMTGCAQWENIEPMAPDTWGPVAELTVNTPDSVLSETLPIEIITKHATNIALTISTEPVEVDYTTLLQGGYGALVAEVDSAGDAKSVNYPGVVPGTTYYLYVVAANGAGVQTTFAKVIGAYDVTAPYITSVFPLTPAQQGRRVTLAFNEAIIRNDNMGAITYAVLDENLETIATGDAAATASGSNLTVTLPETVAFPENAMSFVLLSFAEGAVTDLYENKMVAIENGLDADLLPTGPWWSYENNPGGDVEIEGFLQDGANYAYYGLSTSFTEDESEKEVGSDFFEVSLVQTNVDLSEYFGSALIANEWSMPSVMSILTNAQVYDVPCFSYEAEAQDGNTYSWLTFFDPNSTAPNGLVVAGTYDLTNAGASAQQECYFASWDPSTGSLYTSCDFIVDEMNGNEVLVNAAYSPCVIFIADLGRGESPYILFDFNQLLIVDESILGASQMNYYETPVRLEMSAIKDLPREFRVIKK
ncbi:MAG: hypothetical protein E7084_03765 [Bacteroidales bacterium]|nr:hypothetical protein [Bacteroidales bacterium]